MGGPGEGIFLCLWTAKAENKNQLNWPIFLSIFSFQKIKTLHPEYFLSAEMDQQKGASAQAGAPDNGGLLGAKSSGPWKPLLIANRMRTTSEDSAESFDAYDMEYPSVAERRFSITEKFFGPSLAQRERRSSASELEMKSGTGGSLSKNMDLKEFMKRQRKILGDDEWQ